MIGRTVIARAQPDHESSRRNRARRPDNRILDDRAIGDGDAELIGGIEVKVGGGLAPRDVLAAGKSLDSYRI